MLFIKQVISLKKTCQATSAAVVVFAARIDENRLWFASKPDVINCRLAIADCRFA
jgi:hypothetical protein